MYVNWMVSLRSRPDAAERAHHILQELKDNNERDDFRPSEAVFNAVMHAYAKTGQVERAEAIFHTMCDNYMNKGNEYCRPSAASFTVMILAWCKSGLPHAPEQAEKVLQAMQELYETTGADNLAPNVVTLTSVIECWAKSGRIEGPARAEVLLDRMIEHACENPKLMPNVVTFNTVMTGWARSRHKQAPLKVEKLFQQLTDLRKQTGNSVTLSPDPVTYMARINAYQRSKHPRSGKEAMRILFELLADPEVSPNIMHFNRVLYAVASLGDIRAALEVFESLQKEYKRGNEKCAPNIATYNFLLLAWSWSVAKDGGSEAELLLKEMAQVGVEADLVSYNTALRCWANLPSSSSIEQPLALFHRIQNGEANQPPDVVTYGTMLRIVVNSGLSDQEKSLKANYILTELQKRGLEVNSYIYELACKCKAESSLLLTSC
jgi:pentatricopeptide repeat protein